MSIKLFCCFAVAFLAICADVSDAQRDWQRRTTASTTTRTTTTTTTLATTTRAPDRSARKGAIIFRDEDYAEPGEESRMPQEIPLWLLEKVNEAQNWDEAMEHVDGGNLELSEDVEDTAGHPVAGAADAWNVDGRNGGARESVVPAKPAGCIPELQPVPLISNEDPSVLFIPSCTRIERCGGCCNNELLACEPIKVETVLLQVTKTQYTGGSKLKLAGKENIAVEKHTACKCQCKVKETDCSKDQTYVPGACKCECTNIEERRKCESENLTRFWDSRECSCRCRDLARQCSTGFYFNEEVCRCDPLQSRRSDLGTRVVFGEGGRLSSGTTDNAYGASSPDQLPSPSTNTRPADRRRPWTIKAEDNEDREDKAARPVQKVQFDNKPSWANTRRN